MIEIITDRDSVWVLPQSEFDTVYDCGYKFEGYHCQACRAWHPWQGQGPSPCLSETQLRQQPPQAKGVLAQLALNADWFVARKRAVIYDARALSSAARKAGFWEEADQIRVRAHDASVALERRMGGTIKRAARLVAGSVTRKGFDFRTARPYWVGHVLGEPWCLFPEPGSYRMEQLTQLLHRRTGCTPETALAIARGVLSLLRMTAR